MRIAYPSEDFPAQPSLSFELPQGWNSLRGTGFALAADAQVGEGEFMANVIVSIHRLAAGTGLAKSKAEIHARCERLADLSDVKEADFTYAGLPAYRVMFAYKDAQVGTLVQSGRSIVVNHGEVEDVIQMTSTCSGAQAERIIPQIREIEESLSIES